MYGETRARTILKTASYRIFGSLMTAALAFTITGQAGTAVTIGSLDALGKLALFYLHERTWNRLHWGKLGQVSGRQEIRS